MNPQTPPMGITKPACVAVSRPNIRNFFFTKPPNRPQPNGPNGNAKRLVL